MADSGPRPTRRSMLDVLLWTSLAATTGSCLTPLPFYLVPRAEARKRGRANVGKADSLPLGAARKVMLGERPAIVLNDGQLRALDARCTHQQCPVNWDAKEMKLRCPCHGAVFQSTGEALSGPTRGPLAALRLEITSDGDVIVSD